MSAAEGSTAGPDVLRGGERGSAGLLSPIALAISIGVLVVSLADAAAREGAGSKQALFWAGIALIVLPACARLCSVSASRRERIWVVVLFGLGMFLARVVYDPSRLAFSDEFIHLRSVIDDLSSGRLFSFNPLLAEASHYPGLGSLTSALVRLSGLSISTAGLLIIGSARVVLMLAVFMLVERLSGSSRIAGLAGLLYAGNPNFLYWSAQFSYESLGLPLVVFALYLLSERASGESSRVTWLACLAILAVVATHHLSSYFLAAVLLTWSAVALWLRSRRGHAGCYAPLLPAVFAVAAIGVWLGTLAPVTGQYLGSIAASTGTGLFNVITGAGATRRLFTSGAEVAPLWERLLGVAAVGVTLLALALGAYLIWRRRRRSPLMLIPLALALAYPLLLPLRFIGGAAETANRSSEFLFLGLGAVLATLAFALRARGARAGRGRAAAAGLAALAALIVLGGVAVSWQYSERLPQDQSRAAVPYELGAPARSADAWAAANLGSGRRFASDFLDHLGLATYGRQRPLLASVDGVSAWEVLAPAGVDPLVRRAIRLGHVEYVMVERRLSYGVPSSGFYFDKGEPGTGTVRRPIAPSILAKFDRADGASRVYDNGQQQIYSVAGLR